MSVGQLQDAPGQETPPEVDQALRHAPRLKWLVVITAISNMSTQRNRPSFTNRTGSAN